MTTSVDIDPELLVAFPPSPFIRAFATDWAHELTDPLLDLGCGTGRNSRYLVELGYQVISMSDCFEEVAAARELGANLAAERQLFLVGDVRKFSLARPVGGVLINEVLHMLSEAESMALLDKARSLTRPGGLHAVSGYLEENPSFSSNLDYGDLTENYTEAGWDVLSCEEGVASAIRTKGGIKDVYKTQIVARKPVSES